MTGCLSGGFRRLCGGRGLVQGASVWVIQWGVAFFWGFSTRHLSGQNSAREKGGICGGGLQ